MPINSVALLLIVGFGLPLSIIDIREHRLPNRWVFSMGLLACVALVVTEWRWSALIGAGAAFVGYVLLALLPGAGLGMGDVKLAPVLGGLMGAISVDALVYWLVSPFVLGASWGLLRVATGKASMKSAMAFGPFMFVGAGIALALTW